MNIPDEAVQAALDTWRDHEFDGTLDYARMRNALTAAAPLLQGFGVDAQGIYDYVQSYEWRGDNGDYTPNDADREMLEDAIVGYLSAIEPAPSPRAQALEEAAKIAFDVSENGHYYGEASVDSTSSIYQKGAFEVYEALRALSSQPVVDGWLPTHCHKKRGTEYALIGVGKMQAENWQVSKDGFDQSIDMEEVAIYRSVDDGAIWVRPRSEFEDGRFEALPASPEVSG